MTDTQDPQIISEALEVIDGALNDFLHRELVSSNEITDILLAHEVGHYLGLTHFTTINNVMGVDSNFDGIGELSTASTDLTSEQGDVMENHCSMKGSC